DEGNGGLDVDVRASARRGCPGVLEPPPLQHQALSQAGRQQGVLRRGRGEKVLRRAAHPRLRRVRALGREESARDRVRDRHGHDQLRAERCHRHGRGAIGRVAEGGAAAGGGLRSLGSHLVPWRQRRGAHELRARRGPRPRLLVRGDPPLPPPGTDPRAGALLRPAGKHAQGDGLQPTLLEGALDGSEVRQGGLPQDAASDRRALRSAVRLACDVRIHEARTRADARPSRLPRDRHVRRPHLPVAHSRLRPVSIREGLVFPLAAGARVPPPRATARLAPLRDGDVRTSGGRHVRISVIGLGKLGSPMAACFAAKGFTTVGVDLNESYVDAINDGRAPVYEPQLAELIAEGRSCLTATTDTRRAVADTDATFVIVPTPSEADGGFSLQYVLEAMATIGTALRDKDTYHLVVLTSTVMPGATGGPVREALEQASGKRTGADFGLCYSPEFIALGSVIRDFLNPDFLLIGE